MSTPDTEILVHVTAPARAADDAKYRALAAAHLEFKPTRRTSVAFGSPTDARESTGDGSSSCGREQGEYDNARSSKAEQGVVQSPMLSFQSAIDNLGSPRLQKDRVDSTVDTQSSWQPPPSVIEDSMPDNDLLFAQYCTPTRILNHYTSALDSTQSENSPTSQTRHANAPDTPAPSRPQGLPHSQDESQQEDPVIPLSPGTGGKRRPPTPSTPSAALEETRITSSYPSQQEGPGPASRAESEPPLPKRPRTCRDLDAGTNKPVARSASDVGPGPQSARDRGTHAPLPLKILPDTLEIVSPPPVTAERELRPEDMITDVLARLARELDLERRFRPSAQARPLRPLERGYWLVDCAGWEPALKRSAWAFLADYLGKGAAGWGTACRRDAAFSRIRLYCWGCVVGHMYLVLYLMSKRRVLHTGAAWIGADGSPVVVMAPRSASVAGGTDQLGK